MHEISGNTLALAIQAVDIEMCRLDALSEDDVVPDDQELLVQYQAAAQELKRAYAAASESAGNLPDYSMLVRQRG